MAKARLHFESGPSDTYAKCHIRRAPSITECHIHAKDYRVPTITESASGPRVTCSRALATKELLPQTSKSRKPARAANQLLPQTSTCHKPALATNQQEPQYPPCGSPAPPSLSESAEKPRYAFYPKAKNTPATLSLPKTKSSGFGMKSPQLTGRCRR